MIPQDSIYLVGGAVRDALLKISSADKDWVVVGSTVQQMKSAGFRQVGKQFPVFIHPTTHEEYALARKETKSGFGYQHFDFDFSPTTTLEEDLVRRDLTINAIAQDHCGKLIDPYRGIEDIKNKILRHVSPAFSEDPLRVLRVARFHARFAHLGFTIARETIAMMQKIVASGELNFLSAERIWIETEKALACEDPQIYFKTLKQVGALKQLFPEIDALYGVPNPKRYHPEVDSGIHTMLVLEQAALLTTHRKDKTVIRFAALCHDFGKALTDPEQWPHQHRHEILGIKAVKTFCKRLKVPNKFRDLALLSCRLHTHIHNIAILKPATVIKLFDEVSAWKNSYTLECLIVVATADCHGRPSYETAYYPQAELTQAYYLAANQIKVADVIKDGFTNQAIRHELTHRRIQKVTAYKAQNVTKTH